MNLSIFTIGFNHSEFKSATLEDCYNYLKEKKIISLDIETTRKFGGKIDKQIKDKFYKGKIYKNKEGLDPYLSEIIMFQIGDLERQYIIDVRKINNITSILSLLTDPLVVVVGHNLKFEYKHILHNYNVRINNLYDTMIVEQILKNGYKTNFSLKAIVQKYLDIDIDKNTRSNFSTIGQKDFKKEEIEYGAWDIYYPLKIRTAQLNKIVRHNLMPCLKLEMLFIEVLGDIEYKGMHFNKEIWLKTYEDNLVIFKQYENKLNNFVLNNLGDSKFIEKQLDLFSNEIKTNINWGSPKQVVDLFKHLNICPQAVSTTTKELSYTVNANVVKSSLNTINKDIPEDLKTFIEDYLLYKEYEQSCTTFGKDFFKHIHPITGRLHSNYKQILATGRISSSGPNLQNIPAKEEFRKAFDAPSLFKIVNADYSGQEQIILANKSRDEDLISFYKQGLGDMHSFVASKIFPELANLSLKEIKDNHKDKRQIAKAAGFAINYGGNGYTIAENLGVSTEVGDKVYDAYFKAFPGLKLYFDTVQRRTLKTGYILIDNITNRKNWFYEPKSPTEVSKIKRNALNYPIQGEAGSITKYATILFRNWILKSNLQTKVFITNIVHDEINVECNQEIAELVATNLEKCMKKAGDKWCKIIPLKASAVITNFWNH